MGGSKVLQGSGTGRTPLRQQDLEPNKSCTGMARGVPCLSHLLHGPASLAKAGGQEPVYPKTSDVLEECGMATMQHYIQKGRATIAIYIADCSILEACQQGECKRGSHLRQWWWEQAMCLDINDAIGSDE
jgi:hypothetical protein